MKGQHLNNWTMRIFLVLYLALITCDMGFAQEKEDGLPFTLNGYLETYYVYDFNKPKGNTRPEFFYSFNRHNEVNLNLGFIRGSYNEDNVRSNLAVMTGTYANANLSDEPGVLKNIFEANAGVRISSKKELWVDAGIFASHIGFESAIGKDSWNLTRSILAENSPYYESGAKISYTTDNEKWFFSGMVINGWQRIQRVDGNTFPSFGTQVTFKPTPSLTLNSSTFIGTDSPDSARVMRYFHNFYGVFQLTEKIGLTVGFDYGMEEKNPQANVAKNAWYAPLLIARFAFSDKLVLAMRGEYYSDQSGIIIATGSPYGFKTTGLSTNLDYSISPNALWRLEFRNLTSKYEVFTKENERTRFNIFLSTSLAVSF